MYRELLIDQLLHRLIHIYYEFFPMTSFYISSGSIPDPALIS